MLTQKAVKWCLHVYLTGVRNTRMCVRDGSRLQKVVAVLLFCLSALPDRSGCLSLTCMCTYTYTWVPNWLNCTDSSVCLDEGRCIISEPWNMPDAVLPYIQTFLPSFLSMITFTWSLIPSTSLCSITTSFPSSFFLCHLRNYLYSNHSKHTP